MKAIRMFGILFCLLLMTASTVWGASAARISQIARQVHTDLQKLVRVQRLNLTTAVRKQQDFLSKQPEVREVKPLRGNNLLVHFTDGNELLMFMGDDRLGSAYELAQVQMQQKVLSPSQSTITKQQIILPVAAPPCAPYSNTALIFDCLEDDANVVSPKIWMQVKSDLQSLGYKVITRLNNSANLRNAALIDDGGYGVVFLRGHGGDLGGDFGFLVRPWYTSYPPANSGYTGTIRASAFNHAANATQFGYVITGTFSSTYWINKTFPRTMFFLESCHGADPGALPGMPTWTVHHGASVWLGWNESVSFGCGDRGSDLFFQKMREQKTVGNAVSAVYATGCRPPELVAFPSNKGGCRLAIWKDDPNESAVTNARDFRLLGLISSGSKLFATISFYGTPAFNEFFFYVDAGGTSGAEVLVRCHPNNVEVYKQTQPGLFNNKVYSASAAKSGKDYSFNIPWSTCFGTASMVKVWLYDQTSKDRLPSSGSVLLKK